MRKLKFEDKLDQIKELYSKGLGNRIVSKLLNIPRSSLKFLCDRHNIPKQQKVLKYANMTELQRNVLIGILLGDASISKRGNSLNIGHCEKQMEYYYHKITLLDCFYFNLYRRCYLDKRTNNEYTILQAHSRTYEEIKHYRKMVYRDSEKVITKEILKEFNEISLAYLFMDDGNSQRYNTTIALCSFSDESIQTFRVFLLEKWGIETTVTKQKSIRIRQMSIIKFQNLIRDHIIPSMKYKLDER